MKQFLKFHAAPCQDFRVRFAVGKDFLAEIELLSFLFFVPGVKRLPLFRLHGGGGIVESVGPGSLIVGICTGVESKNIKKLSRLIM